MDVKPEFRALAEKCGPLWAGEAEVARTYFASPDRTPETDRVWLARQCYKEYAGSGFVDPELGLTGEWGQKVLELLPGLKAGGDRYEVLDLLEAMYAEYSHYCLFAEIYDELSPPGAPKLNPSMIDNWAEGAALDNFRKETRETYPSVGWASLRFTEGGYCTLYSEGAKLKGKGGIDGMIGRACGKVYDDEVGHMIKGMLAIGEAVSTEEQWALLEDLTLKQLRLRVHMRNGQFGYPLSPKRVEAIFAGDIEPIAFDYGLAERAEAA